MNEKVFTAAGVNGRLRTDGNGSARGSRIGYVRLKKTPISK